jgi:hypothetical protein
VLPQEASAASLRDPGAPSYCCAVAGDSNHFCGRQQHRRHHVAGLLPLCSHTCPAGLVGAGATPRGRFANAKAAMAQAWGCWMQPVAGSAHSAAGADDERLVAFRTQMGLLRNDVQGHRERGQELLRPVW